MDKPKKKWVSSRLKDKKKELGIVDDISNNAECPVDNNVKESKKVSKPKKNYHSDKKGSKRSSDKRGSKKGSKRFSDKRGSKKGSKRFSDKRGSKKGRDKNRKKHVIKISNLPQDITVRELAQLVSVWGEIGNINVKSYYDSVSSYIDFYNEEEATYFIEALDSTPFDNLIIKVELMDFS